jgi:hypothetical protein
MVELILLTANQAFEVRGPTSNGAALNPIPYNDGFILETKVLSDPDHKQHWDFLAQLPTIQVDLE